MSFFLIGVHGDPGPQAARAFDRLGSAAAGLPEIHLMQTWRGPQPDSEYALMRAPSPATVSELVESVGLCLDTGREVGEKPSSVWERASIGEVEAELRGEPALYLESLPEEKVYCPRCKCWHIRGQHVK